MARSILIPRRLLRRWSAHLLSKSRSSPPDIHYIPCIPGPLTPRPRWWKPYPASGSGRTTRSPIPDSRAHIVIPTGATSPLRGAAAQHTRPAHIPTPAPPAAPFRPFPLPTTRASPLPPPLPVHAHPRRTALAAPSTSGPPSCAPSRASRNPARRSPCAMPMCTRSRASTARRRATRKRWSMRTTTRARSTTSSGSIMTSRAPVHSASSNTNTRRTRRCSSCSSRGTCAIPTTPCSPTTSSIIRPRRTVACTMCTRPPATTCIPTMRATCRRLRRAAGQKASVSTSWSPAFLFSTDPCTTDISTHFNHATCITYCLCISPGSPLYILSNSHSITTWSLHIVNTVYLWQKLSSH
ncbi:hypothetical protein B0H10DRAFT_16218 [Mycena sp. CBHHK59/15]|nr:hypothetical protein B0H10DRAFT_16218 [Mycena sp. CBHHK59/15]